jgi:cystathionine gamma-lyase
MGITVLKAPTADDAQAALIDEPTVKLLWLESPSNPELTVCDLVGITKAARARRILVAHDNTTPTAFAQKPLALGADFSVASDTKATSGHSDVVLGHVSCRTQMLADQVRNWRTLTGSIPGPMESWLALRSLATAALRIERQSANAQRIAEFLGSRSDVERVYYPGLASHPRHELAAQQMQRFGGVLSFTLRDQAAAEKFLSASKLVTEATSFGGVSTTAERRARWGGDDVAPGFIRMSVGCEAVEDLIEDMTQALGDSVK